MVHDLGERAPPATERGARRLVVGGAMAERNRAECHDVGAKYTNKIIPLAEIGTDRERMLSWNGEAAKHASGLRACWMIPRASRAIRGLVPAACIW